MKQLKISKQLSGRARHARKLCCTMLAAAAVFSVTFGISVKAEYKHTDPSLFSCHCGSTRIAQEFTEYVVATGQICPKHDIVDCPDYLMEVERCYYRCPNPSCNDSFFWVGSTNGQISA